ncbi:hypothetical protein NIM87_10225 [Devosia sp. XJ19-1]|uniref:Uncharacterized protein n=1 Tax=Devosia ureilytica TaxID=2952754 RepID=A0A9Q4FT49_9HYPH|nr:hypothetical protein [Devosia ureilytica]MCP8883876.1 hypothetical protein [Devosia ureilytica]MCP8887484.1 hypothetical protein [Devosia ureilytica]
MRQGAGWVALGVALAMGGAAAAQEAMPEGWFLEEFARSGLTDIYLYWLDPAVGGQVLQISCQEGWPDVSIAAFMDEPETEPKVLSVVAGDRRVDMASPVSGVVNERYSTGGTTLFTPEVMDILSGQFSVEVDGVEQGRYSAAGAGDEFARLFEACPVDGDGT